MASDSAEASDDTPAAAETDAQPPEDGSAQARLRRLAEIFGTVLPESTSDDRVVEHRGEGTSRGDDWYLENRPPHH
ncbi:MAG TPA: hypothetical protein VFE65_04065 [Pseudonocardia sp.]|jgi:hypothetical protein|nr:hypothetical protein [Pseudonocardia sp.]